ncbi:MAG: hypothetical protein K6G54_04465 [Oscillospiraceae bacterium]|nr:hypothetical protein [Oscillospiraceae bacterium]
MDHVMEQKCASCGAPLRFDPQQGRLVCDSCGATQKIPDELDIGSVDLTGFDFNAITENATDADAENLPIYNCLSCGAEVIASAEQITTTCPYCGNNIVLTDKVSGKLRPDGVVPFRIDQKALPDALNRFYKGKALLPRNFFSEHSVGKVTGVYVPFWLFSGQVEGKLRFRAETVSTHREGDYVVTTTHHFQLQRDADLRFTDIPVDGSGRIDDKLMDSLEPFHMAEAKPFDMRYLAGFAADRFDRAKDDVADRAKRRMVVSTESAVESTLTGYINPRRAGGSLRASMSARYLLLPVYLFSITHGGKSYEFAVNGQTGKVVGTLPVSRSVSTRYFLLRMGAVAAVVAAAFVAKYMMGA